MKFCIVGLLSLASAALAFENTVPCLMWSPKDYIQSEPTQQLVLKANDASQAIQSSFSPSFCNAKVIAVVDQPMLHCNDFTSSEYHDTFASLKAHNREAASRAQFEYIADRVDVQQVAIMAARQCDSAIAILDASTVSSEDIPVSDEPIVAIMALPALENAEMSIQSAAMMDRLIDAVREKAGDDYVVIYTSGTPKPPTSPRFVKRALSGLRRRGPVLKDSVPIFAKYQLFTPGIFMALGVSLLFVLIAGTGITWLIGIQTPLRFEKPKKN